VANPSANLAPVPNFLAFCGPTSASLPCLNVTLRAIDNARASEGLAPMTLSLRRFVDLSPAEQLLAVTDLERTARGLPAIPALTAELDADADAAATNGKDASLPSWALTGGRTVTSWSSNWASASNVLAADYIWMYSDATGYNRSCPTTGAPGCWGHRDNILSAPSPGRCGANTRSREVMGASVTAGSPSPSIVQLFVDECGPLPSDLVFTWGEVRRALGVN